MRCHFLRIVLAAFLLTCGLTGCGDSKKEAAPKAPEGSPQLKQQTPGGAGKLGNKSE
jgi:hypothetical protein